MNAPEAVVVMTTVPDRETAMRIAKALVDARLAACVNVLSPCRSVYRWQGQVEEADEVPLIIKSHPSNYAALESRLLELHPYDVPEIIALPVSEGLVAYLSWVRDSSVAFSSK